MAEIVWKTISSKGERWQREASSGFSVLHLEAGFIWQAWYCTWVNGWEMQRNKGERLFLIHCSQRQGKGPCVAALLCCSHRYNFRWEFSHLFITKYEGLIESVLISTELIASRTKMFWSCFLAFYIILLFLSLLSFLFLHALISVIPVYPVAYVPSFSISFLWSLSFLSYNFWCSYSRLTLTFRASDT